MVITPSLQTSLDAERVLFLHGFSKRSFWRVDRSFLYRQNLKDRTLYALIFDDGDVARTNQVWAALSGKISANGFSFWSSLEELELALVYQRLRPFLLPET